jgi:hypothetical protein
MDVGELVMGGVVVGEFVFVGVCVGGLVVDGVDVLEPEVDGVVIGELVGAVGVGDEEGEGVAAGDTL